MIDLAAVAAKINALEGWEDESGHVRGRLECLVCEARYGDVWVNVDGTNQLDWFGPVTLLLPVLQIVAEAMAHE